MFGQFRLARNYTGAVVSGANSWAGTSRGPAAIGATIDLDSQGYGTVLARTYNDVMVAIVGSSSGNANVDVVVGSGILPELLPVLGGADYNMHLNKIFCSPSRMEVQISNTSTSPTTGSVYLLRTRAPCNSATAPGTPAPGGAGDPVSVANFLYRVYLPNNVGASLTHQVTAYQPHTSIFRAPSFHTFFETMDSCRFKLAHGAMKTCHLDVPGCAVNPPVDFARSTPVSYNGAQFYSVPGLDLFVVVQLDAAPPVAYSSAAATGSVESGAAAVLVSYRWVEKWSIVQRRRGYAATTFVASGDSVVVPATTLAGYAVMNQFGTAAANANAPIL